jgi:hypothetical protein
LPGACFYKKHLEKSKLLTAWFLFQNNILFPDTGFGFSNKLTWHYQGTIKFEQQKVTSQWDTLDKNIQQDSLV